MKRSLLVLLDRPEGRPQLCWCTSAQAREIKEDHESDGAKALEIKLDGNDDIMSSLNVAWAMGENGLRDRDDGPDDLEKLIKKALVLGASNHQVVLKAFPPRRKKGK